MLKAGLKAGWPICLGYLPIGLAFGVLAQKAGLTPLQIALISIFVFAGSAQFIAVAMIAAGAGPGAIIATTFIVNLRHFLMSAALALHLKKESIGRLSLLASGVTDESFGVNLNRFHTGYWDLDHCLVVNIFAWMAWIISTVAGGIGGQYIPADAFGIDYALVAMFICLVVFQLKEKRFVWSGLLAGVLAIVFSLAIPGNLYVVLASVTAAGIAAAIPQQKADRK